MRAHEEHKPARGRQDPRAQAGHAKECRGHRLGLPQLSVDAHSLDVPIDLAHGGRDAVVVDGNEGTLHVDPAAAHCPMGTVPRVLVQRTVTWGR